MNGRAFRALVAFELRRLGAVALRHAVLGAAALICLTLVGLWTPGRAAFVCLVVSMGFGMSGPGTILRDRLDGGMEFLVSLPVSRSVLAWSRLAAIGVGCLASAAVLTAAAWLTAPTLAASTGLAPSGPGILTAAFLVSAAGFAVVSSIGAGVVLHFGVNQLNWAVVAVLGAFFLSGRITDRLGLDEAALIRSLVAAPWGPPLAAAGLVAGVALTGACGFLLLRRGIARFKPGGDRIEW